MIVRQKEGEMKKMGSIFGWGAVIALLFFSVLILVTFPSQNNGINIAQNTAPRMERMVPVVGEGRVSVQPDIAKVQFTVTLSGKDPKELKERQAKKMAAIVAYLTAGGVAEKDIKTTQYSFQPRYVYPQPQPCPPKTAPPLPSMPDILPIPCPQPSPVLVDYVISQSTALTIRDIERAGELLAGIMDRGATSVSGISFSVSQENIEGRQAEAREIAFQKAKEKAEHLARLGGFTLGEILSVQETYAPSSYPYPYGIGGDREAGAAIGKEALPPQIEPGEREITTSVSIVFAIK